MYDIIQDALDDLTSIRASSSRKSRALNTLERLIADIYVPKNPSALSALQTFITLQDTFQCNIPSRLLLWISETSSRLDALIGEGSLEPDRNTEVTNVSAQITQALSIIQGIVLSHEGSKTYLGRRRALEILVHLFVVARRVPPKNVTPRSVSTPTVSDPKKDKDALPVSLCSTILDTLSCILVDSSPAIRAFEEVNGVKAVVKILKRQGTSREVKIKCMEFLYFYVNAESPAWTRPADTNSAELSELNAPSIPTAPSSPTNTRPTHRPTLSLSHLSDSSTSSATFARTPSRYAPISPSTSDSSPASPDAPTPSKSRGLEQIRETDDDLTSTPRKVQLSSGNSLKYPKTPRKALQPLNVSTQRRLSRDNEALSLATPVHHRVERPVLERISTSNANAFSRARGHKRAQSSVDVLMATLASPPPISPRTPQGVASAYDSGLTRTMEEKKEILRSMMSNVDALLEGMNKVGIWGLA